MTQIWTFTIYGCVHIMCECILMRVFWEGGGVTIVLFYLFSYLVTLCYTIFCIIDYRIIKTNEKKKKTFSQYRFTW